MKDYDVGYKKPPKHTQFKKGQSGNPDGRSKKGKSLGAEIDKIFKKRRRVVEGGRETTMTPVQIALNSIAADAMKGNTKALEWLLARAKQDRRLPKWGEPMVIRLAMTDEEVEERDRKEREEEQDDFY